MRQVTAYLRNSPADVIVAQKNVRTMHMSVSALNPDTPAVVARVEGVAWAEGIRYTTHQHGGRTWWFCPTHCRDEFAAAPSRFLLARPFAIR